MRASAIAIASLFPFFCSGQSVRSVYNRDTHEPFRLKNVKVESTVVGPIVRTSTLLTYSNPYLKPTEATLNFDLPDAAALGGFAYYFGQEYVRGRLMDKNKAWFIYTAITSRGRDPGIMEQWSPTSYHCQIFPIKSGSDLRILLWTDTMVQPRGGKLMLPKPAVPMAVGYQSVDGNIAEPQWTVRSASSGAIEKTQDGYAVQLDGPVSAIAQQFKDGRVYVAGIARNLRPEARRSVKIIEARYEPLNGGSDGRDVTQTVADLVENGAYSISANNATFGDPNPGILKQLRVSYKLGDQEHTKVVRENFQAQLLDIPGDSAATKSIVGLRGTKTVALNEEAIAFSGWLPRNHRLEARFGNRSVRFTPHRIAPGADAARLWAQQMLAKGAWPNSKQKLAFSLKYGVPSNVTALLAVPQQEMRLYQEKQKAWQRQQAEQRRRELQVERQRRNWAGRRNQNWNASGGGDPEIRVIIPGAKSAEAILPDGRVIDLTCEGEVWGGNFEIPANAPEGVYKVRVVAHMEDGSSTERSWTYDVDRTPPIGTAKLLNVAGEVVLEVHSESKLLEVAAYTVTGQKLILVEEQPGIYRVRLPKTVRGTLTIVLKDRASNKGVVNCSSPQ